MTADPTVSVVIPTFNEEAHLATTLASIETQTYPNIVEVLVADGAPMGPHVRLSLASHDRVTVVDNPGRIQSGGHELRRSAKAHGEIVVRVDGHCVLEPDYVDRCVAALD